MLEMLTGPVTILAYRQPVGDNNQPMTRGDGTPVEMCEFAVEGEERQRAIVLNKSVNGSRPPVGSRCQLKLATTQEPVARNGARGPYVTWVVKNQVVGAQALAAK